MTTKPDLTTKPLNWADGVGADVVDPGVAKQAAGWVDFEPVNNGHVNEMLRRYGEYLIYLDSLRSDHQNYVRGTGSEGIPTYSAVDLTISFAIQFTAVVRGQQFVIETTDTVAVPSPASQTRFFLSVNTAGALTVTAGPTIGGKDYDPSPLPFGTLISSFLVPGGSPTDLSGVSGTRDWRSRNPHSPFRLLHEANLIASALEVVDVWEKDELENGNMMASIDTMNSVTTIVGGAAEASNQKNTLAVTGTSVIAAGFGAVDPKRFNRDFRALLTTYAMVGAKTNGTRKIVTDGRQVAIIQDTFCELFDIDGTHKWSHNHSAQILDVHMTPEHVYICGVTNATPHSVVKIARSGGATAWGYDHDADVAAIWADNEVVHFDGAASGSASGATFRIIDASDGKDLANEGGTGTSLTGEATDVVQAGNTLTKYKYIEASDGVLYRLRGAATNHVEEHGRRLEIAATIPTGSNRTMGVSQFNCVAVDQDYIYVGDGQSLLILDRRTLQMRHREKANPSTTFYGVASDGQRVYTDNGLTTASVIQSRMRSNAYPHSFLKNDSEIDPSITTPRTDMTPVKR